MTSITITTRKKATICLIGLIAYMAYLLPDSLGSWFGFAASRIANSYLQIAEPDPATSGYTALMRSLILVSGLGDFSIYSIQAALGIVLTFTCYYILLRDLFRKTSSGTLLAAIVPIALLTNLLHGYVLGASLPLLILGVLALIRSVRFGSAKYTCVFLIVMVSLSFIWHSAFGILFSLVVSLFLIMRTYGRVGRPMTITAATALIYFFAHWFFVLGNRTSTILENTFDSDMWTSLTEALRTKGNLALEHSYRPAGLDPQIAALFILVTYATYFIGLTYALACVGSMIRQRRELANRSSHETFGRLLISAMAPAALVFGSLYFLATGAVGPVILVVLMIPLIYAKILNSRKTLRKAAGVVAACITIIIGLALTVSATHSSPSWNIPSDRQSLEVLVTWTVNHSVLDNSSLEILSDSYSIGNIAWDISATWPEFYSSENNLVLRTLDYETYDTLVTGNLDSGLYYVDNRVLFDQHLEYGSMSSWTVFEPVNPQVIADNFCVLFSSGEYALAVSR